MEYCKFFLQSRCSKGASCAYRHERPPAAELPTFDMRSQAICRYAQGCRKKDCCPFRHPTETVQEVQQIQQAVTERTADTRSQVTCKYYIKGLCLKGSKCPFLHPVEQADEVRHVQDDEPHGPENDHDTFQRALYGALVQFADGASVSKLSLSSDFSSVRLQGLPAGSGPDLISRMAQDLHLNIPPDAVRMFPVPDEERAGAQITVEDPRFAKAFCEQLTLLPNYAFVQAIQVPPRLPSWATTRRISCKKVIISWHRPTRLVWLNFGERSVAQRVTLKFNSGYYKILGRTVRAGEPTRSATYRSHVAYTVLLENAPSSTSVEAVRESIKVDYDLPRHIELSKHAGVHNVDTSMARVEKLVRQIGPVEFTDVSKDQGKRFKAVAIFADENDAREAVDSLHDKAQRFLNKDKLSLQLMSSSKFRLTARIHQAVEDQLAAHIPEWREKHLNFRLYPDSSPQKRFVTLKVEGAAVKDVACAANVIDDILAGRTIEGEKSPFWNPLLATNGVAFQTLKQIEQEYGILIVRDRRKRELKYFGPTTKYSQVRSAIIDQLSPDVSMAHILTLNDQEFRWACRGGFNLISTALGGDVVSFDVVSTPKRLVMTGSEDQYRRLIGLINCKEKELAAFADMNDEEVCAICWTSAEDPVNLSCGHLYCSDCFERLCLSGDSGDSDYTILCQGDMGNCKKVLALPELRVHLSSQALEDVFGCSFATYVRRRAQDLKYCPTPDCGYLYRASGVTRLHTCTKCLELLCTACCQQHGTMSCAEYNDIASGGYEALEQFKKKMKIKDCPKCTTPIEKTFGCNHMTCGGCKTHICWVCLDTFKASEPCYDHLAKVHGSIFPDMEEMLANN